MGLWANNLPLFDDDKTHEVIYAWISKASKKLPLNSCISINNKYDNEAHESKQTCMQIYGDKHANQA